MSHITCCYIFQKRKSFRGMSADSADSTRIPQGMGGECKVLIFSNTHMQNVQNFTSTSPFPLFPFPLPLPFPISKNLCTSLPPPFPLFFFFGCSFCPLDDVCESLDPKDRVST